MMDLKEQTGGTPELSEQELRGLARVQIIEARKAERGGQVSADEMARIEAEADRKTAEIFDKSGPEQLELARGHVEDIKRVMETGMANTWKIYRSNVVKFATIWGIDPNTADRIAARFFDKQR